ncbi:MAG: TIGR00159 family protein [Gemmatimonadetes bacterium]|nr:TIGR00159 family protein [Gemmatimonadota bacterium]
MDAVREQLRFFRPGWGDLVEIAIVSVLFYRLLVLIHRTRAMQMLLGIMLLAMVYLVADRFDLILIRTLLAFLFQYGAIAALVVFQPELRSALARLGQSRMFRPFSSMGEGAVVDEIMEAVEQLTRSKIGAIIAIENDVGLDEYAATGSRVEARISSEMLTTIFTPYSPLHDGAVILHGGQIKAAGAILPLTQYSIADKTLGTRHRAAIGLSEETDAVVIVVSEETARVSVARRGRLERDVDLDRLREVLTGRTQEARSPIPAPAL